MSKIPRPRPQATIRARVLYLIGVLGLGFGLLIKDQAVVLIGVIVLLLYFIARHIARINFSKIELKHHLPESALANMEFDLELELSNRKWISDTFTVEIEDGLLGKYPRMLVMDWVKARKSRRVRRKGRVMNRGIYERSTYFLRSRFPFGLFAVEEERAEEIHLVVYPRPNIPAFMETIFQSDNTPSDRVHARFASRTGEFRGLREFHAGDPLRNVHWSSTARSGRLMVREFDPPVPERFAIVYHCFKPERQIMRVFSFEKSLRILAGLFSRCSEMDIPFSFTASFDQWHTQEVTDPRDITGPMTSLAGARQVVEDSPDELIRHINLLRGYTQVFVVSNIPVHFWQGYVEQLPVEVVCIDNSSVYRKPRGLVRS